MLFAKQYQLNPNISKAAQDWLDPQLSPRRPMRWLWQPLPTRHGCMIYIRIRICVRAYGAPYTHLRRQRHYRWHCPVALYVQEAHISALTAAHPFVDSSSQQTLVGASFWELRTPHPTHKYI
jgi:hypothetical protein